MSQRVVGLYFDPWAGPEISSTSLKLSQPLKRYKKAVWVKSNPRDQEYMNLLFAEKYDGGLFVKVNGPDEARTAAINADKVIILYPDSIGLGFSDVEKSVKKVMQPHAELRVLNGRKRDFLLNSATWRALIFRRFLEKTMLGEILVGSLILALTLPLLVIDLTRGRK